MLDVPFNKAAVLRVFNLNKKRLKHRCFSHEICESFQNIYFEEHLPTTRAVDTFEKEEVPNI